MADYPVVVYGASGYTGMLIIDWLIDQRIPFRAVGRSAERIEANMRERVVRTPSGPRQVRAVGERGRPLEICRLKVAATAGRRER